MDIWMGGVYILERRMLYGVFSDPIFHSPMALIVAADRVEEFSSMARIKQHKPLRLAIFDNPGLRTLASRTFPWAQQVLMPGYDQLDETKCWDAALWTLEQGGVWASSHPGYTAVRPKDLGAVAVFAYLMPKDSVQMRQLVNHWLQMRRADGFLAQQRGYWIEGRGGRRHEAGGALAAPSRPWHRRLCLAAVFLRRGKKRRGFEKKRVAISGSCPLRGAAARLDRRHRRRPTGQGLLPFSAGPAGMWRVRASM